MLDFAAMTFRLLLLFQSLAALGALAFALVSQYGFNQHPCDLCILQRYPYVAAGIVGLLGYFFAKKQWLAKLLVIINLCLFMADAGIASYHAGVEKGIFTGPSACSGGGAAGDSLDDLRAQIMAAPLVSCAQAMGHFMGLSMAAWNALYALCLIIVTLLLLRFRVKTPA